MFDLVRLSHNEKVNLTDEELHIMPSSDKGFVQAYNGQASAQKTNYFILKLKSDTSNYGV